MIMSRRKMRRRVMLKDYGGSDNDVYYVLVMVY